MTENSIYGHILDYLDIRPHGSLLERTGGQLMFEKSAENRDIKYNIPSNEQYDWIIYSYEEYLDEGRRLGQGAKNTAVMCTKPISVLQCLKLRARHPVQHVIRIKLDDEYMSSEGFLKTFKRTYKNADLNKLGKFLVSVKVACKLKNTYPMTVFVI